ncbi:hypothetical protein SPHINGO8BC_51217 [Sphingobacterium multivorum]|uniref:Uncharacterized protein n=1 Tax=Sphingobacterium multivorum TaxID=28454 RepID=A0A654CWZ1_SPHMU|nr:hypothetical protein SPHINGO8BC_51217 [Sphingobacterium multivorum]
MAQAAPRVFRNYGSMLLGKLYPAASYPILLFQVVSFPSYEDAL